MPQIPEGYAAGTVSWLHGGYPIETTFEPCHSPTAAPPQVTAYAYDPFDGLPLPIDRCLTASIVHRTP